LLAFPKDTVDLLGTLMEKITRAVDSQRVRIDLILDFSREDIGEDDSFMCMSRRRPPRWHIEDEQGHCRFSCISQRPLYQRLSMQWRTVAAQHTEDGRCQDQEAMEFASHCHDYFVAPGLNMLVLGWNSDHANQNSAMRIKGFSRNPSSDPARHRPYASQVDPVSRSASLLASSSSGRNRKVLRFTRASNAVVVSIWVGERSIPESDPPFR
jgi:hypothetical protein